MWLNPRKGAARITKDLERRISREPKANWVPNRTLHSKYEKDAKAHRNKGRNRHKTGRKRQKRQKRT
jgi:hypothetical protein